MRRAPAVAAKGGFREDLGIYVRSKKEANYARYLIWLQKLKIVRDWKYESKEWEFPVKRGPARFYKSDFWVEEMSGKSYYVEIKDYMDAVSKTKLKRMALYYPEVTIRLISPAEFKGVSRNKKLIPNWE